MIAAFEADRETIELALESLLETAFFHSVAVRRFDIHHNPIKEWESLTFSDGADDSLCCITHSKRLTPERMLASRFL